MRLYRERLRAGRCVVRLEVDDQILDFIVRKARWLTEAEAQDAARIGLGIIKG
jgi:hypothetical protein